MLSSYGEVSSLAADSSVRAFQADLLETLEAGSKTLPNHGDVSSISYFDGLRLLLNALVGLRYTGPFKDYVAERVGLPSVRFDIAATANDLEYQPPENRYHLFRMAAWLLEDWPARFVETYRDTRMAPSYLLGDADEVPGWLGAAVEKAQETRQKFMEKDRFSDTYRELSEQAKADLSDFSEHGAERLEVARERVVELEFLLEGRYLTTLDSPLGELVVLAGRGKAALGRRSRHLPTPENAAGQMIRRRVRERLEAQGWQSLKKEGRNLISLRSPEGVKHYLLCGYGAYDARTVRRNVAVLRERLVKEKARLIVVSKEPEQLLSLEAGKRGELEVIDASALSFVG